MYIEIQSPFNPLTMYGFTFFQSSGVPSHFIDYSNYYLNLKIFAIQKFQLPF